MSNTSLLGAYGDNSGSALMFRNRIINGDMRIDQRNGGQPLTINSGASFYMVDRFWSSITGAGGVMTGQQVVNTATSSGVAARLTVATVPTNTSGSNYWHGFIHSIEGHNVSDFAGKTVTLSFKFKAKIAGTYPVAVRSGDRGQSYVTNFSYTTPEVTQTITKTIQIPSSGVITNTTTERALDVVICFVNTQDFRASSLDSWTSGNKLTTAADTAWWTTIGNYVEFGDVQLELGATATPFEKRLYSTELAACQRYHVTLNNVAAAYGRVGTGIGTATTSASLLIPLPVAMRAAPLVANISRIGSWALWTGATLINSTSMGVDAIGTTNTILAASFDVASGLTIGSFYVAVANNDTTSRLNISSEIG